MADQDGCDYCLNPENGMTLSPQMPRPDALALYLRLQGEGYLPTLCENRAGRCRVCYAEKQRIGG
ncbi:MAG: hypothetical protein H6R10_2304 [Rhodocyclaceae bacterium]|nr:hypothetical protein [Rhodocyclaceae bacterium]